MDRIILDDFKDKEPVSFLYLVPFAIQLFGVSLCAILGLLIIPQFLIGAILLGISGLVFFFDKKKGIIFQGIISILAVFKLINFFPIHFTIGPSIGTFGIEAISLGVFLLILHFNGKIFYPQFQQWIYGGGEMQSKTKNSKVKNFESRYKNKSIQELEKISNNSMLVEEARTAAKNLIQNKQKDI